MMQARIVCGGNGAAKVEILDDEGNVIRTTTLNEGDETILTHEDLEAPAQ